MDAEKLQRWADPKRILVATNLTDERVLTCEAASQARETGARIILVHVFQPSSPQPGLRPPPDGSRLLSRRGAAWNELLRMARMIDWEGAPCEPVLLEGEPVGQIRDLANRRGVDRVIVATRSARGLDRLLAGSVAEALMDASDVPVCVIGPHAASNPFRGIKQGRVLLALSLNHDRADCVQFITSLANTRQSVATLMHVLDISGLEESEREIARAVAHSSIVAQVKQIQGPLPQFLIDVREGAPSQEILAGDICPGWDLIVMGSSSPGILSKFLGGSVVYRVIAEARCPVITLRRQRAQEEMLSAVGSRLHEAAAHLPRR